MNLGEPYETGSTPLQHLQTTHVYLEADLATKEQALQKLAAVEEQGARFTADDPLLAFLNAL